MFTGGQRSREGGLGADVVSKAALDSYLNPTEDQEQMVLAEWLDMKGLLWMHCPNESKRPRKQNPRTGKWYSLQGQKLKRMGMKAGFPDVIIFDPPPGTKIPGVAIELKRRKGGRVSDSQKEWLTALKGRGWAVAVCHGAGEAIKFLENLGYSSHYPEGK
jgi:hypothetical protein